MHKSQEPENIIQDEELAELYMNAANLETPDLWSRIEAGIQNNTDAQYGTDVPDIKPVTDLATERRKRKKVYTKYLTAAAVLLILVIPAWFYFGGREKTKEMTVNDTVSGDNIKTDDSMDMMEEAVEAAPEEPQDEGVNETPTEAAPVEDDVPGNNDNVTNMESAVSQDVNGSEEKEETVVLIGTVTYLSGEYYITDYELASDSSTVDTASMKERLQISNPLSLPLIFQTMQEGDEGKAEVRIAVLSEDEDSDVTMIKIIDISIIE